MCNFLSFVTEPENHGGQRFYSDWEYRKILIQQGRSDRADSHSSICITNNLVEDICNKYEYNPLTKEFTVDQINSRVDDRLQAEVWVRNLDFKKIVPALVIKPLINPLTDISAPKRITRRYKLLLKQWDSMGASMGASVWASMGASVGASVWASVGAYASSFFDIQYPYDYSDHNKLWNAGLVPSFDGTTWRLHAGQDAKIVYEISAEELRSMK